MNRKRLVIFHYHLLPGGVTSVIAKGIEGILGAHGESGLGEITVVSGGDPGAEKDFRNFLETHREAARRRGISLGYQTLGELAYSHEAEDLRDDSKASRRLADLLNREFPDAIWWVHNYHIGKNPRFTQAILLTARERPEQQLFLYIHDFPENGRFANLNRLKARITLPLYPIGPGIRYITINGRDHRILRAAGIPREMVHHLPNPVSADSPNGSVVSGTVKKIYERQLASEFPAYRPGVPWGLYPVRTIRRKNILEAALGALLFPGGLNLIVTLPGLSAQERGYSDLVEGLFRGGIIPGLWGTGLWRDAGAPPFEDLALSADLILSSSLQEGFGYFFIDAFRWGKPLLSRSLEILDEILPLLPARRAVLYESLRVPPEQRWVRCWKNHLISLERRLPESIRSRIPELPRAEHFLSAGGFDFSALPPDEQADVLRRAVSDSGYLHEIREGNPRFCRDAGAILKESRPSSGEDLAALQAQWGLAAFGQRAVDLINRKDPLPPLCETSGRGEDVFAAFTTPKNMRPLFFPYPGDTNE